MDDDGLEVIDLTDESDSRHPPPRPTRRWSRKQVMVLAAAVVALAIVGGLLARHRSTREAASPATPAAGSRPFAALPTTMWVPPAGLNRLASGRSVAVLLGTPLLVRESGQVQKILEDIPGIALVDVSQRGAALVQFKGGPRVIVGPEFDGTTTPLPAALELLPDAEGRWWSNFGELRSMAPRAIRFPKGLTPVAKLRRGYLFVDDLHTGLFEWPTGPVATRIGRSAGEVRVLAIAGDLVAWTDDAGFTLHVTNLRTDRDVVVRRGLSAVTARFSPDRSRVAILSGNSVSESMTLLDSASGAVIADVVTASGGNGLAQFDDAPPAFQPVPFSWDATGRLVVIAQTTVGYFVSTIDSATGSTLRRVAAPEGLQQLVSLAP